MCRENVPGDNVKIGEKAVGGSRVIDGLAIGAFVDRVGALAKGLVQPRIEATRAVVEERDTLGGAVIRRRAGRKRRGLAAIEAVIERSEEHTSELQSLMRNSYAVLCLKKKK